MTRVVLVPGVLALLPEHAGLTDPVADLRVACLAAVGWLGAQVEMVAAGAGRGVAEHLLAATPERAGGDPSYLMVANGSARRSEAAPGYLDERAVPFDDALGKALVTPDPSALAGLDHDLGDELWATTRPLARLADLLTSTARVVVDYDDDPYGVQYWVVRWETTPSPPAAEVTVSRRET